MRNLFHIKRGNLLIVKKIWLQMRLITILLFTITFCLQANTTYSQNALVNLNMEEASLIDIFREIEKQSEYRFFYNNTILNTNTNLDLHTGEKELTDILEQLFGDTDMTYKVVDKYVVITSKGEKAIPVLPQVANRKIITGTVVDERGEPIIGANVVEKGSTNGVITDMDGNFSLSVSDIATLQVSYIGYIAQEVFVKNQISIQIVLREDSQALEEVVVIGYGVAKKKDLTGAVSQLSSSKIKDLKVTHPTQALAGQMAGVQVQQAGGMPGEAATIHIRGAGSLSASSAPLYVVDGYPLGEQNLNAINPNDIESIEVLKDASASAIYGSRAANGVVLVTTKSGKAGKVSINLDVYYGFQDISKRMDLLDAQEFVMLSKEAFNNNYVSRVPGASASDPLDIRPAGNRYRYPAIYDDAEAIARMGKGTDWQDEIFRTAPIQNYQLSVTGGDEKSRYMFSAGYFKQDGVIIGSDYERFSARAKIDSEFTKWLKVGINIAPTYMKSTRITEGHWSAYGVVLAALSNGPIMPVRNEDGSWSSQAEYAVAGDGLVGITNPVANALGIETKDTNLRLFANMYAEVSLMKNLKLKSTLGADVKEYRHNLFWPSDVPASGVVAPLPSSYRHARDETEEVINWLNENTISYFESFGKHEIDAVAGLTTQKNVFRSNKARGTDFPDDIIRTINNAKVKTSDSDKNEWSLLSYLARVNYRYNNRYYLTASIRADGSSRFGKNNRYGYFPSASVAWRISQEEFMEKIDWLSDMKIRASYGLTGNNSIPNYGSIGTMGNYNYVFGTGSGNVITGSSPKSFSNADLTWEKTKQFDLGFEISVFNSRLSFIFDYYKRKTTDLLLNVDIPTITGFDKSWRNIGKIDNEGFEFSINTINVTNKDFTWQTNLNMSTNSNKVVALGPSGDPIYGDGGSGTSHITMIGKSMGSFFGYKQIGVYMNQADLDNSPRMSNSAVGDVKYADINGDGVINADDRTILGNNNPKFTWGMTNQFTYKSFDLGIVLQGVHGRDILHLGKRFYENLEGNMNQLRTTLNRWQSEENPGNGKMPRMNSLTTGQNNAVSSRWIEDASFVRINNITLGYTLPQLLAQKCSMQNARVYVSIQNLATFTGYTGYNPETSYTKDYYTADRNAVLAPGTDYGIYPLNRTFTLGVNVTF